MTEPTKTILIVDDNLEDRETYKRLLTGSRIACRFVECDTGEEGLGALQEYPVDCVLLDFQLPDMDGIEVLDEMEAITADMQQRVPTVFLTGQGSEQVAVQAMKSGAADYLVKSSLDGDTLARSIHYAISRAEADAANRDKQRLQGVLEMAGAVCHELSQPLQVIGGYAELLPQLGPQADAYPGVLAKMADQIERLKKLIQQLMTLTQYETKMYPGGGKIIDIHKASSHKVSDVDDEG